MSDTDIDSSLEWLRRSFSQGLADTGHEGLDPDNAFTIAQSTLWFQEDLDWKARLPFPVSSVEEEGNLN